MHFVLSLIVAVSLPAPSEPSDADTFHQLRVRATNNDLRFGSILLASGVVSLGVGAGLAIAQPGDRQLDRQRTLSIGVNLLIWGAVDSLIAGIYVGISAADLRRIEQQRGLSGDDLHAAASRALARDKIQATVFLVNAALDVGYVATGASLWIVADHDHPKQRDLLAGVGIGAVVEGAFLLLYDLTSWLVYRDEAHALNHFIGETWAAH